MTAEQLAAIRASVEAATPGPWKIIRETDEYGRALNQWQVDALYPSAELADAEFVAQSRADVPALLGEIDALLAENDRLRAVLRHILDSELGDRHGTFRTIEACPQCLDMQAIAERALGA